MGKSTISSMFKLLNIPIFDSDKEVKDILEKNYGVIKKIYKKWPETVLFFGKEQKINKKALSDIIFKDIDNRKILEKIIHPIVHNNRVRFIEKHRSSNFVGLDVPLLYETDTHKICDYIFLVNTSKKNQIKRVLARPNMTLAKFNLINEAQWSFEKKKKMSPFIINTSFGKLFSFVLIVVYLLWIILIRKKQKWQENWF